ncbi:MAG: ATP-binding protein [Clostridia bacterium]|nr:ATP-binding protein [Clostridia bacterium]
MSDLEKRALSHVLNKLPELNLKNSASLSPSYKCPLCEDTGWVRTFKDGYSFSAECECRKAEKSRAIIRNSGLEGVLDTCTFENFKVQDTWQSNMKYAAVKYVDLISTNPKAPRKPWLYIGGNPGCGKTMLCTAICGELLKKNFSVRYMIWPDAAQNLKAYANDPAFQQMLAPYINCRVLYIDDLFKSKNDQKNDRPNPSDPDVRLAFEILNARYTQDKPTIISSEWYLDSELIPLDQGTFSRVYERCKNDNLILSIPRGLKYNMRLRAAT